jgi:uncharacterized protein (DUF952 family)/4-amino-4-deoxy-L-arabinose transferase-like glycosyltransferase
LKATQENLSALWLPPARAAAVVRGFRRVTVALLAVNIAWRLLRYALGFPLWGDEAFIAASLFTRDFSNVATHMEYGQAAPALFMWAELAATRLWGLSIYAMRLAPMLSGLAAAVLFWDFAQRVLNARAALLAVAVFAASVYPVRHACEVKPYATDLLAALALLEVAWAVRRRPGSLWRWAGLTLLGGVAVWCSYPAAFVFGGVIAMLGLGALRCRSGRQLAACTICAAVTITSFAIMAKLVAAPQHEAFGPGGATWINAWPPLEKPWLLPWWLLDVQAGNMMAYPIGGKHFGSSATLLLAIVGAVILWRRGRRELLGMLLIPVGLTLVAAALHKYPYGTSARIAQHMAPAFCLLMGVGIAAALGRLPRAMRLRGVYAVAALIAAAGMAIDIVHPYKELDARDCRNAVSALAKAAGQGDRWVIFNSLDPVSYAPLLRDAKGSGASFLYYVRYLAPAKVDWSPPAAQVSLPASGHLWLIAYYDNNLPMPQEQLDAYVAGVTDRLGSAKKQSWDLGKPSKSGPLQERMVVWEYGKLPTMILHITHRGAWKEAVARGAYTADSLAKQGFIHCSAPGQVVSVANANFPGQKDLVLLCIDPSKLKAHVKYENLEGGQTLFPHVYGPIDLDAVMGVLDFPPDRDGSFHLPHSLADSTSD